MTLSEERRAQADDVLSRVIAAASIQCSATGASFETALADHFAILRMQWPTVWALACARLREDDAAEMLALAGGTVCDD